MSKLNLLVLYFFLLSSLYSLHLCCHSDHKRALLQFKSSLLVNKFTDELFYDLQSWTLNSDCCQWDRVVCNYTSSPYQQPIIALDLSRLYIETFATMSPVFNIDSLTKLDMSKNFLQGEIPISKFSKLTQLVYLDISYNNLVGPIPSQLFHLRNLEHLDISGNSFSGELSSEFGRLSKLKFLNLAGNSFTGEILKKELGASHSSLVF